MGYGRELALPSGPGAVSGFHIGSFPGPAGGRTPAPFSAGDPDAEERPGDLVAPEGEGGPEEAAENPSQKQRHRSIISFHQDGEPSAWQEASGSTEVSPGAVGKAGKGLSEVGLCDQEEWSPDWPKTRCLSYLMTACPYVGADTKREQGGDWRSWVVPGYLGRSCPHRCLRQNKWDFCSPISPKGSYAGMRGHGSQVKHK